LPPPPTARTHNCPAAHNCLDANGGGGRGAPSRPFVLQARLPRQVALPCVGRSASSRAVSPDPAIAAQVAAVQQNRGHASLLQAETPLLLLRRRRGTDAPARGRRQLTRRQRGGERRVSRRAGPRPLIHVCAAGGAEEEEEGEAAGNRRSSRRRPSLSVAVSATGATSSMRLSRELKADAVAVGCAAPPSWQDPGGWQRGDRRATGHYDKRGGEGENADVARGEQGSTARVERCRGLGGGEGKALSGRGKRVVFMA